MGTKKWDIDDLVGAGFERLDSTVVESRPPRIQWGRIYREKMSDAEKIAYLERLASTMNHAAALLQKERNTMGTLCEKKEAQLIVMKKNIDKSDEMLQQQITRLNADRQNFVDEITKLRNKIRAFEAKGDE